jgi:hypothetical protein
MSTDIKLDDGQNQDWVTVQADVLHVQASDVIVDHPSRRVDQSGFRRALVHDQGDSLTINFNGDYPGGVAINNARLNLKTTDQDSITKPQLPRDASVGDLILVRKKPGKDFVADVARESALWLCVDVSILQGAQWQMLLMGNQISGTA